MDNIEKLKVCLEGMLVDPSQENAVLEQVLENGEMEVGELHVSIAPHLLRKRTP